MIIVAKDDYKISLKRKKEEQTAWEHTLPPVTEFYRFEWQNVFGCVNCVAVDAACRLVYEAKPGVWYSTGTKWAEKLDGGEGGNPFSRNTFGSIGRTWFLPEDLRERPVNVKLIAALEYTPAPIGLGFCNVQFDEFVVWGE